MGVTGAVAVGTLLVATMAQSNIQSHAANDKAQAAADKQEADQNKLMADAKKQSDTAETSAQQAVVRDQARQKQLNLGKNFGGASSTIMTSPLGITGPPSAGGGKTLLGS